MYILHAGVYEKIKMEFYGVKSLKKDKNHCYSLITFAMITFTSHVNKIRISFTSVLRTPLTVC